MMYQLRPHQQVALDALAQHLKGICVFPTGGGKTNVGIFDAIRLFQSSTPKTVVVTAPRILLAEQLSSEYLEFITNASVLHVHSGETHHFSSTRPNVIRTWYEQTQGHKLIFTTYNSLQQLAKADIEVDTIYFDEAHNSVQRHFFPAVEHFAAEAKRCYFFTATPKYSATVAKPGMNDVAVYGNIIAKVPAPDLVQGGYIIPPKVITVPMRLSVKGEDIAQRDCEYLMQIIQDNPVDKILVCAKATRHIIALLSESDFADQLAEQGYSVLHITAKHGAFIDGQKVNREVFFDTLNAWGKDPDKKFVVLLHSILAESVRPLVGLCVCTLKTPLESALVPFRQATWRPMPNPMVWWSARSLTRHLRALRRQSRMWWTSSSSKVRLPSALSGADFSAILLTLLQPPPMKYNVIFVAGNHRLAEEVYANSPREAQEVVKARNPNARIVNVTGGNNR
jgi:hypothetical protein